MHRLITAVMAFAALLAPLPLVANPADADQVRDRAARVTLAARQAALLHSMSMSVCFSIGGLDAKRMASQALEQADTYDTVLHGLRDGQQWMNLLAEQNPVHLDAIAHTDDAWHRFEPAIRQLVAGDWHSVVMRQSVHQVGPTSDRANALAVHYLTSFGADLIDAPGAAAMTLASRYRMLSQRALAEMCYIHFELGLPTERLRQTLQEMDAAQDILRAGGTGVAPPPNGRVARNLRTAVLFWGKMRPTLDQVAMGASVPEADLQKVLKFNRSVLKQLDQAVAGYIPAP